MNDEALGQLQFGGGDDVELITGDSVNYPTISIVLDNPTINAEVETDTEPIILE